VLQYIKMHAHKDLLLLIPRFYQQQKFWQY